MVIDASEFVRDGKYKEGKFLIVLIGVDDEVCNFQDIEGRKNKCEKRKPQFGGCLEKNVGKNSWDLHKAGRLLLCGGSLLGVRSHLFSCFCLVLQARHRKPRVKR